MARRCRAPCGREPTGSTRRRAGAGGEPFPARTGVRGTAGRADPPGRCARPRARRGVRSGPPAPPVGAGRLGRGGSRVGRGRRRARPCLQRPAGHGGRLLRRSAAARGIRPGRTAPRARAPAGSSGGGRAGRAAPRAAGNGRVRLSESPRAGSAGLRCILVSVGGAAPPGLPVAPGARRPGVPRRPRARARADGRGLVGAVPARGLAGARGRTSGGQRVPRRARPRVGSARARAVRRGRAGRRRIVAAFSRSAS